MTIKQAEAIRDSFIRYPDPTDEDFFSFTEAMDYLIQKRRQPDDMMLLAGIYYEKKEFELALKYYEMATGYNIAGAYAGLGYIWYYGRTGEPNYEKAFRCYSKAAELGDIQSAYKVADMYKNGYYVSRDYEKYKEIIRELYPKVSQPVYPHDPFPEVAIRLAGINTEEGRKDEALKLYDEARRVLAQRIRQTGFFGDLSIMKGLIDDLYRLAAFDEDNFDLYDLYHLLKEPCTVTFRYEEKTYTVRAVRENGECVIDFMNRWFRTRDDFFARASINGRKLISVDKDLYMFEVKK